MTLSNGSRLGPYEVLSRIGAGGMGEVWKARDTRLGREVAVKVLPEELSGEKDRLRRFEQEARAASARNHPNVLKIHDIGFGLARLISPEKESGSLTAAPTLTAATEPGVVMGTVGYMSPEQVRGKPADPRSDIFSFGAVLYEMLAGRRAFRGDSAVETMSAILKEEPAAISASRSDIGPACERIVRRCLEKTPEQRFQSARDLAFALSETVAASPALPAVPERSPSRRVLVPALTAGILAVGLGALVLAVRTRGSARGVARPRPTTGTPAFWQAWTARRKPSLKSSWPGASIPSRSSSLRTPAGSTTARAGTTGRSRRA